MTEAAKSAEVADALRGEIQQVKAQAADERVTFAADMATFATMNLTCLFYSCTALEVVSGSGNLAGVKSCGSRSSPAELDFRGFDPSALTDLTYCFSGCSSLVTIYANATWVLPSSGVSGSQCFYNCYNLTGGKGTTYASSRTVYTHFRIDTTATPGYLTVSA